MDSQPLPHPSKGMALATLSMLLFSITYTIFKACDPYLSNTLILFFQSLASWIIILPIAFRKSLATSHFGYIALRTLFGLISLYCITRALTTVNLAEVLLLNNSAPLYVPIIGYFWFRTVMPKKLWWGLLIGFAGIYVILRPGFQEVKEGQLFAMAAGISGAFLLVVMRKIAHEPLIKVLFYYFLLFCLFLSPFLFTDWQMPPLFVWGFLILSGFMMIAAQLTLTAAFRYAPPHEVAPFVYTSVLFAGMIDWILWGDRPDLIAGIGMIIVCVGGVISLLLTTKKTLKT